MKKNSLIGQKFDKLTVISRAPNIPPKNGIGRSFVAWNCRCDCGNIIVVRKGTLLAGQQKSCGCHIAKSGIALKPGQKFNRLTTVSYDSGYWNCICDCGNNTTVLTHHLISGNTKSCGCLKTEAIRKNQKLSLPSITKYEPHIATARRLWRGNCYSDIQFNLLFEQWFDISQQPCFYCGCNPYNTYNYFTKKKDASQYARDNGYFAYNGLDRTNNSLSHTADNVVPCCPICNRFKSDRTVEEFYQHINRLQVKDTFIPPTDLLALPTGYLLVSIKGAYRHYPRNYGTMEIGLPTFYTFSQLPCFYCGAEKTNYFNIYLKDKKASQAAKNGANFHYNGIDRLDNTKTHAIDNIAPCCYYCNFAKGKLALPEFQAWIKRVQQFQEQKNTK